MARILVIDDEPSVRASLEQILVSAGHQVIEASDGLEGVAKYRKEPCDVVVVDLFMPGQDGIETIAQLRKIAPAARVIAISGNPLGSTVLPIAEKLGAVAVLEKPFSKEDLTSAVQRALAAKGSDGKIRKENQGASE